MKRLISLVILVAGIIRTADAAPDALHASAWLTFPQAQVRLLASTPDAGGTLRGGVEIRLQDDFKTYWRNPGDSGVPPQFDFSVSTHLAIGAVQFPLPTTFDDGAGGKAWGYKHAVILPFSARKQATGASILTLKLDFAVCGKMCIPLSGILTLDLARAEKADKASQIALMEAEKAVPVKVDTNSAKPRLVSLIRLTTPDRPAWTLVIDLPDGTVLPDFFPDSAGYLMVSQIETLNPNQIRLTLSGDAPPGAGGRFGETRLVFGKSGHAFEMMLDLDGAPNAP